MSFIPARIKAGIDLPMCKKLLRTAQMSTADVLRGQSLAADLLRLVCHGPGDLARAMKRIERDHKVPVSQQWALRYRPPKRIWSDVLAKLEAAHAAETERQLRKLAHDIAVTAQVAGADHRAVVEAQAVLDAALGERPHAGARVAPALLAPAPQPPDLTDLPLFRGTDEPPR